MGGGDRCGISTMLDVEIDDADSFRSNGILKELSRLGSHSGSGSLVVRNR